MKVYAEGVEWESVRQLLREKDGALGPREKRALVVTACGGFWPEARRWRNGLRDSAECEACQHPYASDRHRIHECDAMEFASTMWVVGGRTSRIDPRLADKDHSPLMCMGLPPVVVQWTPVECQYIEGAIGMGSGAAGYDEVFGDGSGYRQQHRKCRIATWAIVRMKSGTEQEQGGHEHLRGNVVGWYSTVPRGELTALISYLQHAGPNEAFIGDCAYVIEGARGGVSRRLMSSTSPNADLWREVKRRLDDRECAPAVLKTRAHRSQREALEDTADPIRWWHGNKAADAQAKGLARSIAEADTKMYQLEEARVRHQNVIVRVALGAAWAYRHWPAKGDPSNGRRGNSHKDDVDGEGSRHVLYRDDNGRLECRVCRKYANARTAMARMFAERCKGDAMGHIHPSHNVRTSAGVAWCTSCGAYTTRQPRLLAKECNHKPMTTAQRNVLRRLSANLPPTTAAYLGNVAVASGGIAGADNSHAEEVIWRRSAGYSDTPRDHVDIRPAGPGRAARAPSGRYARLAGGRLHHASVAVSAVGDHDHEVDGVRALSEMKEYTAPTTPLPSSTRTRALATSSAVSLCVPTVNAPWSRRLMASQTACASSCNACAAPTRTSCRGCSKSLCLTCARSRRPCSSAAADPEAQQHPP